MDDPDLDLVTRIAHAHLAPDDARIWLGLLRPAVRLEPAVVTGRTVVATLGGEPMLPPGASWPGTSAGPMTYIGEVRCGAVRELDVEVLPPSGRVLLFRSEDDDAGAAVHVDDGPAERRPTPAGVPVFEEVRLTGRRVVTSPMDVHPALLAAFGDDDEHPVQAEAFVAALRARDPGPMHQVGGYSWGGSWPAEVQVALAEVGAGAKDEDPAVQLETVAWNLLVQVDTSTFSDGEDDVLWGDVGMPCWLGRPGVERVAYTSVFEDDSLGEPADGNAVVVPAGVVPAGVVPAGVPPKSHWWKRS